MRRFARGEAPAFEELYRRHELRVFRYLMRSIRSHAVAEELLQETWFAVVRDAQRYQPSARFTTWLFTIAHNRMVDAIRGMRPQQSLDAHEREALAVADGDGEVARDGPFAATLARDQLNALRAALASLPTEQREVFLLQLEGDLSIEEIATITDCTFETAKSRLRYARDKLRERLRDYA